MDSWVAKYWHKLFSEKEQGKYCHPHGPPSSTNKPTSQALPPPPQPNARDNPQTRLCKDPAPPSASRSLYLEMGHSRIILCLSVFILLVLSSFSTADEAAVMSELLTALNPAPSGWSASTSPCTSVEKRELQKEKKMPFILSFLLFCFFIYF
jgi:hypothetical protein